MDDDQESNSSAEDSETKNKDIKHDPSSSYQSDHSSIKNHSRDGKQNINDGATEAQGHRYFKKWFKSIPSLKTVKGTNRAVSNVDDVSVTLNKCNKYEKPNQSDISKRVVGNQRIKSSFISHPNSYAISDHDDALEDTYKSSHLPFDFDRRQHMTIDHPHHIEDIAKDSTMDVKPTPPPRPPPVIPPPSYVYHVTPTRSTSDEPSAGQSVNNLTLTNGSPTHSMQIPIFLRKGPREKMNDSCSQSKNPWTPYRPTSKENRIPVTDTFDSSYHTTYHKTDTDKIVFRTNTNDEPIAMYYPPQQTDDTKDLLPCTPRKLYVPIDPTNTVTISSPTLPVLEVHCIGCENEQRPVLSHPMVNTDPLYDPFAGVPIHIKHKPKPHFDSRNVMFHQNQSVNEDGKSQLHVTTRIETDIIDRSQPIQNVPDISDLTLESCSEINQSIGLTPTAPFLDKTNPSERGDTRRPNSIVSSTMPSHAPHRPAPLPPNKPHVIAPPQYAGPPRGPHATSSLQYAGPMRGYSIPSAPWRQPRHHPPPLPLPPNPSAHPTILSGSSSPPPSYYKYYSDAEPRPYESTTETVDNPKRSKMSALACFKGGTKDETGIQETRDPTRFSNPTRFTRLTSWFTWRPDEFRDRIRPKFSSLSASSTLRDNSEGSYTDLDDKGVPSNIKQSTDDFASKDTVAQNLSAGGNRRSNDTVDCLCVDLDNPRLALNILCCCCWPVGLASWLLANTVLRNHVGLSESCIHQVSKQLSWGALIIGIASYFAFMVFVLALLAVNAGKS